METTAGSIANLTASGQIKNTSGLLVGVVINSHTGGTLKFWNNTSAAGPVLFDTLTLGAGERYISLFNANFSTACFLSIGGIANVSVIYK